jgi:hypothetical protein
MDTIFTLGDIDEGNKLNIDELYEKKQISDMNTLNIFNKILNRIHNRIKTVSRQNAKDQFCWYLVPEVIIGVPQYDHGNCIAYLVSKLNDNGFNIKYTHPNLFFISWKHWIPTYVRTEIKKKTGLVVDGYGNTINKNSEKTNISTITEANSLILQGKKINQNDEKQKIEEEKNFKNINSYKPTGNLVYNKVLLKKLEDKFE